VRAAGINPSDGKAMLGAMPSAVFPRTPHHPRCKTYFNHNLTNVYQF